MSHVTAPSEASEKAARFGRAKNTLKMGIVGLPNVGKSSLFNLLSESAQSAAANFPFCTIDPSESRCPVPDERYDFLCNMWNPPSKYPAYLQIWDIAGLVKGASAGAGLGNAFLSHISSVDGIYHVVRAFDNEEVIHVDDSVDPVRDLTTINQELCKKDLQFLERAIANEEKEVRKSQGMKISQLFRTTMDKVRALLEDNKPVRTGDFTGPEVDMIRDKLDSLLTTKPMVYLVNLTAKDYIRKKNKFLLAIHTWVQEHGGGAMIPFSVDFEEQAHALRERPEALAEFFEDRGAKSALPRIIVQGYADLKMLHFFTAGDKEVRCWTVRQGAMAPESAGQIHTDFEKNFIKAEVVSFKDFKELATSKQDGIANCKAAGKWRQEGKTYVVQDGDIIHFQIGKGGGGK